MGELAGVPVILCATGIGKVNTAAAIATVNANVSLRAVLQLGIGGAYPGGHLSEPLDLGAVAVASSEYDLDLGVGRGADWQGLEALGCPAAATDPPTFSRIPCDAELSIAAARAVGCRLLPFATSDRVTADAETAADITATTGAAIESMEGSAGALVCLSLGLRFAEVRAVSNVVGDREKSRWRVPQAVAAASTAALLALPVVAAV